MADEKPVPVGWGAPGLVDRWLEELTTFVELPTEDASEAEVALLPELRAMALAKLGWEEPPGDWRAHFFVNGNLLRYLRGRQGALKPATTMLCEAVQWFDTFQFWDKVRRYEEELQDPGSDTSRSEAVFQRHYPVQMYGTDKRGANVLYLRHALIDGAGLMRETSMDFLAVREAYGAAFFWAGLHRESTAVGTHLAGRIFVSDMSDFAWGRAYRTQPIMKALVALMKDRMPESIRAVYVVNAPWYFSKVFALVKPFMPKSTQAKIKMYKSTDATFHAALGKEVERGQIPEYLGGGGAPGPFMANGGDVPEADRKSIASPQHAGFHPMSAMM